MGAQGTRDEIVAAADRLFYERGFEHTSFASIAGTLGISRGNFYYHFRTKDEILDAVLTLRAERTRGMLDGWEAAARDPAGRIRGFIHMLVANGAAIAMHGCPVGSLCTELAKLSHPAHGSAGALFSLFGDWLERQFHDLGFPRADARAHARHALVRSQGIAVLAQALGDERCILDEVRSFDCWLDALVATGHST